MRIPFGLDFSIRHGGVGSLAPRTEQVFTGKPDELPEVLERASKWLREHPVSVLSASLEQSEQGWSLSIDWETPRYVQAQGKGQ